MITIYDKKKWIIQYYNKKTKKYENLVEELFSTLDVKKKLIECLQQSPGKKFQAKNVFTNACLKI